MLRIKIDVTDPKIAKVCLYNGPNLVDYEVVPYTEDFEFNCLETSTALREKFQITNTPIWKRAQEVIVEIEAKCNATEFGKRGEAS